jgi:hypothetical protein
MASRLPIGALELKDYFTRIPLEYPQGNRDDPHWKNGTEMCEWWIRLDAKNDLRQVDIDAWLQRHSMEANPGSGWLDLGGQFKHWAEARGFRVSNEKA